MAKRTALGGVDKLFRPSSPSIDGSSNGQRDRVRTSVYLDPEDVLLLDQLQSLHFQRHRKRLDRSALIRRAIRAFHRQLTE